MKNTLMYGTMLLCLLAATPVLAQDHAHHTMKPETPEATADAFRAAMVAGDSSAVAALLADDVVILEGGKAESKNEYLSHHFHGDKRFLAAMSREPISRKVSTEGHAAWVASISRLHGNYRDRDIDLNSAELLVMRHGADGWQIAAIHWSSRSRD